MTRVTRGLLRLWVVLSVLWIGAVAFVTWQDWRESHVSWNAILQFDQTEQHKVSPKFDPAEYEAFKARANIERGVEIALIPPIIVLAIGLLFVWVVRGFRRQ
jgi:hypothetical protein